MSNTNRRLRPGLLGSHRRPNASHGAVTTAAEVSSLGSYRQVRRQPKARSMACRGPCLSLHAPPPSPPFAIEGYLAVSANQLWLTVGASDRQAFPAVPGRDAEASRRLCSRW